MLVLLRVIIDDGIDPLDGLIDEKFCYPIGTDGIGYNYWFIEDMI